VTLIKVGFRCIPPELWGIDNNLNIANMDWDDFAQALVAYQAEPDNRDKPGLTGADRVIRRLMCDTCPTADVRQV
jgi:hypothetical protein